MGINTSFILVGEGGHLAEVLQRCWPWAERGHPAPPHKSEDFETGEASALGENSSTIVQVWYLSCRSGICLEWYWVSYSSLLGVNLGLLRGSSLNLIFGSSGRVLISSGKVALKSWCGLRSERSISFSFSYGVGLQYLDLQQILSSILRQMIGQVVYYDQDFFELTIGARDER